MVQLTKCMIFRLLIINLLTFLPIITRCDHGKLDPQFYEKSCPQVQKIVRSILEDAVAKEPRMAASILRLHFHDCFVQGCDASLLLDSSRTITSEKGSNPNRNSARGFEVIDEIKSEVEKCCPKTVSCADILALAARDSTVLRGGPYWEVILGRRDSRTASLNGSNANIPAPNNTLPTLIARFKQQGLTPKDLVALSGSHTIGNARCTSFRARLYNQTGPTLNSAYASELRAKCPSSGGDQNLFNLDRMTPFKFDNWYYKNLLEFKGLLNSDQSLFTKGSDTEQWVKAFADSQELFFKEFAKSIVKMGNINPLMGSSVEIRNICRRVNQK